MDRGMTFAGWVRQALRQRPRSEPGREVTAKLDAIRAAARMEFPTGPIEEMLEEIERGSTAVRA